MEKFNLNINGSLALFLFLVLVFIGMGIIYYQRTNPPISRRLGRMLTAFRVAALLVILFILFEPVLTLNWIRKEKPVVAILLDTSASMSLTDEKLPRATEALSILKTPFFEESSNRLNFQYYQFSQQLKMFDRSEIDSLKFVSDGTNLSAALEQLYEKNSDEFLSGIILLSDGCFNLGENPLRRAGEMNLPVYPISVGTPVEKKDVIVAKVFTNQIAYAENEVPVNVTVRAFGFEGETIRVNLFKETELIDFQSVSLGAAPETEVKLKFTPTEPGMQKYRVQIPTHKNELTPINNQQNFYVKVLKSRMKILFLTGGPGPDFSFIKRVLAADPNIEVDYWVAKRNQGFYQGELRLDADQLKKYDCLILQNFPPKNYTTEVPAKLGNILATDPKPLLFIAGDNINYSLITPLKRFLPFDLPLSETAEVAITARLTASGNVHPVTRIADDEIENRAWWANLPPIFYSLARLQLHANTEILAEAIPAPGSTRWAKNSQPLLVLHKAGGQKSLALLGYGSWRWDLLSWGVGKTNQVFSQLLGNSIRWLINREDSKTVRIYPAQEIFRSGQEISFFAEVYTENYQPLDGADVKLKLQDKTQDYHLNFTAVGEGKYEGKLPLLAGGDYRFEGQVFYNNVLKGTDSGQFSVENFNLEFLQTQIDENFLRQLALKTGGEFIADSSGLSRLNDLLDFPARPVLETREWQLWNLLVLLIAVILLLSLEWYLRKRRGML